MPHRCVPAKDLEGLCAQMRGGAREALTPPATEAEHNQPAAALPVMVMIPSIFNRTPADRKNSRCSPSCGRWAEAAPGLASPVQAA